MPSSSPFSHLVRRLPGFWLLLLLALVIFRQPAQAQQLSADPALQGLVIWQALPDPAGWLWLATDRGGYRYDGQHLVPLRALVQQGPPLPAGSMRAVLRDAQGRLWWGGGAGLWAFEPGPGRLRPVPLPDYPAKRLGVTALGWHRGRLWVGRDADPFSVFSLPPGPARPPVRAELRHPVGWVTGFAPDSLGRWRVLGLGRALAPTPTGRWQVQRLSALYHGQLLRPGHDPTWLPPGTRLTVPGTGGRWQLRATGLYRVMPGRPAEQTETWAWSSTEVARVLRVVELDSTWIWSAGEQVLSLSLRGLRGGQRPVLRRRTAPLQFGREMELVPLPDGRTLLGFRFDAPGAVRVAPRERAAEPLPTRPARPLSTRALGRWGACPTVAAS
ncbi:hypothetical protein KLP40_20860 [Hymenobacter sp. NST-14]|uniref:hypothetical protein n=1 Tax=Hymenobacter piscis TaxID=2839984 RepID=UPI001C00ED6F|nr:hypothetical protein [Hymenobacter piscis]MBT9395629.1 hypothetical protein [Hymenobacter piscis]